MLLNQARQLISEAEGQYLSKNNKIKKCDEIEEKKRPDSLEMASNMLETAETLISEAKQSEELPSFLEIDILIRDIYMLRCRIFGSKGNMEGVVAAATKALEVIPNIVSKNKIEEQRNEQIETTAHGYKGYALLNLKLPSDALSSLEISFQMQQKLKLRDLDTFGEKSVKDSVFKERIRRELREAATVKNALSSCYSQLGIFNPPLPELIKFPRTAHLFDAGGTATTSDDLLLSQNSMAFQSLFRGGRTKKFIIEEKIDGANLGISICPFTNKILVQNRSHYISSGEHAQFSQIPEWIHVHRNSLMEILTGKSSTRESQVVKAKHAIATKTPEKKAIPLKTLILYGEWVVARHSIPYQKLPGYFIAFDLFDVNAGRFYSRERFHLAMKDSCIPVSPTVAVLDELDDNDNNNASSETDMNSKELSSFSKWQKTLRRFLDTKSAFRNDGGTVEGIVIRVDEIDQNEEQERKLGTVSSCLCKKPNDWLVHRFKIVRPDFIRGCDNGHWATRKIEKQTIDHVFAEEYMKSCCVFASSSSMLPERVAQTMDRSDDEISMKKLISSDDEIPMKKRTSSESPKKDEGGKGINEGEGDTVGLESEEAKKASVTFAADNDKKKPSTTTTAKMKKKAAVQKEYETQRSRIRRRLPRCIILMGLPGAGKTTFANRMALENASENENSEQHQRWQQNRESWTIVNQDRLGRKECEALAGRASRNRGRVIIDRCNTSEAERDQWLEIMHSPSRGDAGLVYFATEMEQCISRVQSRVGHETIPHGRGEHIVRGIARRLEPPTEKERKQKYGIIEIVHNASESNELLRKWGVDLGE